MKLRKSKSADKISHEISAQIAALTLQREDYKQAQSHECSDLQISIVTKTRLGMRFSRDSDISEACY